MTKLDFDLRLLDVYVSITTLEEHFSLVEKQIDLLILKEGEILNEALEKAGDDEAERQFARDNHRLKTELELPRLFRNSYLILLWSAFEAGVVEIAQYIHKEENASLKYIDIKGDNFIDKMKKYFQYILNFELCEQKKLNTLSEFLLMRNFITHSYGRMDIVTNPKQQKLINKLNRDGEIEFVLSDYAVCSSALVKRYLDCTMQVLRNLADRTRNAFPRNQDA